MSFLSSNIHKYHVHSKQAIYYSVLHLFQGTPPSLSVLLCASTSSLSTSPSIHPPINSSSQPVSALLPTISSLTPPLVPSDQYNRWAARILPMPRCSLSHHLCRQAITFPHHRYPSSVRLAEHYMGPICHCSRSDAQPIKVFYQFPRIQLPADDLKPCLPALRLLLVLFPWTKAPDVS